MSVARDSLRRRYPVLDARTEVINAARALRRLIPPAWTDVTLPEMARLIAACDQLETLEAERDV